MLRLDSTLRKLEILLSGAVTTTQPAFMASWSDGGSSTYVGGATPGTTNGASAVTLVTAPASGIVRDVDYVSVNNLDSATATVTVRFNDNGTSYNIITVALAAGSHLNYTHAHGWEVLDSNGVLKTGVTGPQGQIGAVGPALMLEAVEELHDAPVSYLGSSGPVRLLGRLFDLLYNTLTGTKAQFNAACSDDDFAYLNQGNTFTQQQFIVSPVSKTLDMTGTCASSPATLDISQVIGIYNNTAVAGMTFSGGDSRLMTWGVHPDNSFYFRAYKLTFLSFGGNLNLDLNGNGYALAVSALGLGFGAGSGGTVTQATSKSTSVTLNKPAGQITMNNAALLAATTVGFVVNDSVVGGADTVQVTLAGGYADAAAYQVWAGGGSAGSFAIYLRNISLGTLSEAVVINFTVLKGSTS